ncbi:hypothetical protein Cgig2_009478 [Carnegiea gigantea]|uniref:Uncharacterized protein n=1 Tax=Carnegiea gigantea TaxID=171969 RepID=A0A9Q1K7G3_9CARY|nr:hypothetical protein Cgig2_009478 [Carnegiea gigantea]
MLESKSELKLIHTTNLTKVCYSQGRTSEANYEEFIEEHLRFRQASVRRTKERSRRVCNKVVKWTEQVQNLVKEVTYMSEGKSDNKSRGSGSAYVNEEGRSTSSSTSISLDDDIRTSSSDHASTIPEGGQKQEEAGVDIVIRHRCTLKAVCGLSDGFEDLQNKAIWETVWSSVLDNRPFAIDGHLVWAPIEFSNPDAKSFKLGCREVPFSFCNVPFLTGLPATRKPIIFEHSEGTCEVEQPLKEEMDALVTHKRRWKRTIKKDMRIYRNYVSIATSHLQPTPKFIQATISHILSTKFILSRYKWVNYQYEQTEARRSKHMSKYDLDTVR